MNSTTNTNAQAISLSSTNDLLACFREVPDSFFRPDFSLQQPEMFALALGYSTKSNQPSTSGKLVNAPYVQYAVPSGSSSSSVVGKYKTP